MADISLVSGGRTVNGQYQKYDTKTRSYQTPKDVSLVSGGQMVDGVFVPQTPKGGTTSGTGIVSSDSVLSTRNQDQAMNQAANALTTDPNQTGFSPLQMQYANLLYTNQQENLDMFGDMRRGVELMYDAQLARTNQQYSNLLQDLQMDFQKQSSIAEQQAAALNPYSTAQGAMTARNFQGAIQGEYQKQAARLQEAATIAQQELAAGNAQAYIEITNQMKQSNQAFQKGMMEFMMQAQQQQTENQQWQAEFGLNTARFGLEQQKFGEDRFTSFIEQFSQDPAFKQNLQSYYDTGTINEGLMPLIERGMAAGLSPAETLSIAQYETSTQRAQRIAQEQFNQEMDLGWYNAQTSRLNAIRQAQADAKVSNSTAQVFNSKATTIVDKGLEALSKLTQGGLGQTGVLGQFTGWIDASAAGDLESVYNTIRANISFDQLAQMRAESPTGGALGNVSNFEGQLLMDAEGSLRAGLRKETQVSNLTNIMAAYINTQTAVSLDSMVANGELTQAEANKRMRESVITGDEVLADFNQQQLQNQMSFQSNTTTSSGSTPAVGDYLSSLGYD